MSLGMKALSTALREARFAAGRVGAANRINSSPARRSFSTSMRRCYDEFTRKKSEYRIPGHTDTHIREKNGLVLPVAVLTPCCITYWILFQLCE